VIVSSEAKDHLLVIQSDLLEGLNTRVVVPLIRTADAPKPAARLNPIFTICEERYVVVAQFMAAIPFNALGTPVDNLERLRDEIVSAIDMLTQGF